MMLPEDCEATDGPKTARTDRLGEPGPPLPTQLCAEDLLVQLDPSAAVLFILFTEDLSPTLYF